MTEVRVPDVPGVIVGWRTWTVRFFLSSRGYGWPTGGPLVAEHRRYMLDGGLRIHPAPAPDCLCGIHAVADPADLIGQPGAASTSVLEDGRAVAGQVALWGKVIRHERGYRAEYARPLSVVPLWQGGEPEHVQRIRERYALPLVDCPEMAEAAADEDNRHATVTNRMRGGHRGSW